MMIRKDSVPNNNDPLLNFAWFCRHFHPHHPVVSLQVVKPADIPPKEDPEAPVCVVTGAIAKGSIEVDYNDANYCIGNYPLSAALTCAKVTSAFEEAWGVF